MRVGETEEDTEEKKGDWGRNGWTKRERGKEGGQRGRQEGHTQIYSNMSTAATATFP